MQSGGGSHGRNPAAPSSSSSSPSSSAVSNQLGFESIHQQQQQLNMRNQQQHQQQQQPPQQQQQQLLLRKPEGEENLLPYKVGGVHGVISGSGFPSSSSAVPVTHSLRKFTDSSHQLGNQFHEDNQNKLRGSEQHLQNPVHQAYLQFALQAAQQQKSHGNMLMQQQGKFGITGPHGRDQDMHVNSLKMQELMSLQAASQSQVSMFQKSAEQFGHGEKQMEQGRPSTYQRNDLKPPQNVVGQQTPTNMVRPGQSVQSQASMENTATNQLLMAQFQAWAVERNIDLSLPANANLIAQLLPIWQSARLAAMQKPNESSTTTQQPGLPSSKQQFIPTSVGGETSTHGNYASDLSGQAGQVKSRQTPPFGSIPSSGAAAPARTNNVQVPQQLAVHNRDSQNERTDRPSMSMGNGGPMMHPPQSSGNLNQSVDHSDPTNKCSGTETLQTQYFRQLQQSNRPPSQPAVPSGEAVGTQTPTQGGAIQGPQQRVGFTKQQLHVLKAQILAFRRLKRGEGALPQEVLQAIVPPPFDLEPQQCFLSPGTSNHENSDEKIVEEHAKNVKTSNTTPQLAPPSKGHGLLKEESVSGEEKAAVVNHLQGSANLVKERLPAPSSGKAEQNTAVSVKAEQEVEQDGQSKSVKSDNNTNKGKATPVPSATVDSGQINKSASNSSTTLTKDVPTRKYHGPIFDFLFFTRKSETFGLSATNSSGGLTLTYDIKDLLYDEGLEVLNKKRTENQKKISGLLAINLERKRIRPDLVLRLQIEEKNFVYWIFRLV